MPGRKPTGQFSQSCGEGMMKCTIFRQRLMMKRLDWETRRFRTEIATKFDLGWKGDHATDIERVKLPEMIFGPLNLVQQCMVSQQTKLEFEMNALRVSYTRVKKLRNTPKPEFAVRWTRLHPFAALFISVFIAARDD